MRNFARILFVVGAVLVALNTWSMFISINSNKEVFESGYFKDNEQLQAMADKALDRISYIKEHIALIVTGQIMGIAAGLTGFIGAGCRARSIKFILCESICFVSLIAHFLLTNAWITTCLYALAFAVSFLKIMHMTKNGKTIPE
jgi:hypothetical protein